MISARPKAVLLIAAAACGLASCQQQKTPDTVAERSPAPEAKPGIMVSQGALVLPAVKRNPGAAYFTLANGSNAPVTLAAVTIDRVGKTEMHESVGGSMAPLKTLTVAPGATVRLERGGKHVMLFDIAPSVRPGSPAEMTLTFAGGDKVSVPLAVVAIGGDGVAAVDDGERD